VIEDVMNLEPELAKLTDELKRMRKMEMRLFFKGENCQR
jgi:hypothetical protein